MPQGDAVPLHPMPGSPRARIWGTLDRVELTLPRGNPAPMTAEMEAHLRALAAMPDETIDTSDIPEVLDWSDARRRVPGRR